VFWKFALNKVLEELSIWSYRNVEHSQNYGDH